MNRFVYICLTIACLCYGNACACYVSHTVHKSGKPLRVNFIAMIFSLGTMPKLVSLLFPCCAKIKNAISPKKSVENNCINSATEVTIDDGIDQEADRPWSVARAFGVFFHTSPNSKLALKLFGNEKSVIQEKKRQEKGSLKWMIHPYSYFRFFK